MDTPSTIHDQFRAAALRNPDRVAVLAGGSSGISFGELATFVDDTRDSLHRCGLGRESRLGILMTDRAQTAVMTLVAAATCPAAPMNVNMTLHEFDGLIRDIKVDAIVVNSDVPESLLDHLKARDLILIQATPLPDRPGLFELHGQQGKGPDPSAPGPDDVLVFLQTSGTTAKPKIVPQSQLNRLTVVRRVMDALKITTGDRCLNMMPMHHSQGVNGEFLVPLLAGASVAFSDFKTEGLPDIIDRLAPTWFNLVPSMHQDMLMRFGDRRAMFAESTLRFVSSSSSKMALSLRNRLESVYGVPLLDSYGSSESGRISCTGLPWLANRKGSVGKPLHKGVMIADSDGQTLPHGSRGEICISGPSVIKGYLENPEDDAESFRNDWYRTGDEGYFDEDGFLFVNGRIGEMVNRGGEKFSLQEIDEAILAIEGVLEGAAFTVPDERLGHEIYAAVVLNEASELTPIGIRAELAGKLSWARIPKRIVLMSELPKNLTGKILRNRIAEVHSFFPLT